MGKRAEAPAVNAGSMADIAFLLLIFFLVTTTIETDAGLDRMLSSIESSPPIVVNDRNILEVNIGKDNQLMVDGQEILLADLRKTTIAFIDNGGEKAKCNYCKGEGDADSSDSPNAAIVSVKSNRETTYDTYIAVQNELVAAYHTLRNRESQLRFNQDYKAMEALYGNQKTDVRTKQKLKLRIKLLQNLFPLQIVEPKD